MIEVDVELQRGAFSLSAAFSNGAGLTALFGRSGSGKSTIIHLIAGLARPDRGRIVLDGRPVVDTAAGLCVPRHRRRIGLVFQDAQLFPHLSVRQNLVFGRWFSPRGERRIDFDHVVGALGVEHLLDRRPARLSGGERQRIALGRAVLASPRLLLMDEPLASLDMARKLEILPLIERLRDEFAIPIVYVSHAIDEVARLASRVVVLDGGRVRAVGDPAAVLGSGALIGSGGPVEEGRFALASVLDVRVGAYDAAYGLTALHHPAGTVYLAGRIGAVESNVRVVVRATDVTLATARPAGLSIRTAMEGTVSDIRAGSDPLAAVDVALRGHGRMTALATRKAVDELRLAPGAPVLALIKTVALDERTVASARDAAFDPGEATGRPQEPCGGGTGVC